MRFLWLVLGIACIALGGLVLGGKVTRTQEHEMDVGFFRAEATTHEPYPQWVGYGALALGVAFMLGAVRRSS
jgi:hypothetical protein